MKKIISVLFLMIVMAGVMPSAFAYTDVYEDQSCYESVMRLGDLGIIAGYSDGSFGAERTITRAEFTRIVVCMMDKEEEALARTAFSGFTDVRGDFWATPYINYAVSENILSGYTDGTFCPDKTITLAEAVTVLLRTIGYTEKEVGYFWPDNYINAAQGLGISKDVFWGKDQAITREIAAILVDRTMFASPAGQGKKTYIESLGFSVLDDALVLDTDEQNGSITLLSGNLKLGNATTYISKTSLKPEIGEGYAHIIIDRDGYLVAVKNYDGEAKISSKSAVVNKLTDNTIELTLEDGAKENYRMDDNFVIYFDNSKMSFASAKQRFTSGADITFYGPDSGVWSIAVLGEGQEVKPVLASGSYNSQSPSIGGIGINHSGLTVYRDGKAATLADIAKNDVVYYNTKTNVMDVYSKKVTGIYYSASPSKAYVESVTVGGKSYQIGHSAATAKLDASAGAFEIGDKVTLLLGENDEVCFAVELADEFDYFAYGVVVGAESRIVTEGEKEGMSENVVRLFMADGNIHEVVTSSLYTDRIGEFVSISYNGGKASLTNVSDKNKSQYAGDIDTVNRTVGSRQVLKDAAIIQLVSKTETAATCELLEFELLEAKTINELQIINVVAANGFGDAAIMYVKSLENSYSYGVVAGFEKSGNNTTGYEVFTEGSTVKCMLGNKSKITTAIGAGVAFKMENGQLSEIKSLHKVNKSGSVSAVEGSRIKVGDTIYKMAQDVEIVDVTDINNLRRYSVDELASMGNVTVTLYTDKILAQGGMVRVITLTRKK